METERHYKRILHSRLLIILLNLAAGGALCLYTLLSPDGVAAQLLRLTHATWSMPPKFGVFHILSLVICVALCASVFIFEKAILKADTDSVLLAVGLIFFWLELYKQLYHLTVIGNGYYNFGILPLQFCSYVLYLYLLIPLLKDSRIKSVLYSFCALFLPVGGAVVLLYPLMYTEISLSLHTMIWHTLMVATGLFILKRRGLGACFKREVLSAFVIFLFTLGTALAANVLLTPLTHNSTQPLNLFYLSPYIENKYIIVGHVQRAFGWAPSVLCYSLLVLVGASAVWLIGKITRHFSNFTKAEDMDID
ncbi:MAG: hypothetical protein E7589_08160 [Ruminococcaceae bacterium]|nr:hypothetical protein [Oscillospiraceae bacterium]